MSYKIRECAATHLYFDDDKIDGQPMIKCKSVDENENKIIYVGDFNYIYDQELIEEDDDLFEKVPSFSLIKNETLKERKNKEEKKEAFIASENEINKELEKMGFFNTNTLNLTSDDLTLNEKEREKLKFKELFFKPSEILIENIENLKKIKDIIKNQTSLSNVSLWYIADYLEALEIIKSCKFTPKTSKDNNYVSFYLGGEKEIKSTLPKNIILFEIDTKAIWRAYFDDCECCVINNFKKIDFKKQNLYSEEIKQDLNKIDFKNIISSKGEVLFKDNLSAKYTKNMSFPELETQKKFGGAVNNLKVNKSYFEAFWPSNNLS